MHPWRMDRWITEIPVPSDACLNGEAGEAWVRMGSLFFSLTIEKPMDRSSRSSRSDDGDGEDRCERDEI